MNLSDISILGIDLQTILTRAFFLLVVFLIALIVQHVVVRAATKLIERIERISNASIILNILRAIIWIVALLVVLEPVFGIKPTALITGLGITSIVISLGLKDTIANIIGGIGLMVTDVISVGDYVTINGITGSVTDLTWRHTIITNRLGERVVIPNSILNTTAVVRLPASSESRSTIDFTMDPDRDTDAVAADIIETIQAAGIEALSDEEGMAPTVYFSSITPYGISGQIFFYVKPGIPFAGIRNKIVRALADKPYFSMLDIQRRTGLEAAAVSALE